MTEGSIEVAGDTFPAGRMMVFRPGDSISAKAGPQCARLMVLGGATMNEKRYIWWNFVSSSKDKIEEAKEAWMAADWENGPFQLPTGDDAEHIPITPEYARTTPKDYKLCVVPRLWLGCVADVKRVLRMPRFAKAKVQQGHAGWPQ